MRGGNPGEGESMVAGQAGRASLGGSFEDAVCPLGGSRAVARGSLGGLMHRMPSN